MPTAHHQALAQLLQQVNPQTLLLIDPGPVPVVITQTPGLQIHHLTSPQALEGQGRFDLGAVANTLEHLDHKAAGILLARLRDLHTERFVVLVPMGEDWEGHVSQWQEQDLLAFGLTLMARFEEEGRPLHLYEYNLATYKTTPDWLNSRYWAHPERWVP